MNEETIKLGVLQGRRIMVVEFRSAELEATKVTEKSKTAKPYVKYTLISDGERFELDQFGKGTETVKLPDWKRGDRLALIDFQSFGPTQWGQRCKCDHIEPVTAK